MVLEDDNYLRQAGAAFALARAARFFGEDRYTARATQAILALLDDTVLDPKEPVRCTSCRRPSSTVSRRPVCLSSPLTNCPTRKPIFWTSSEQLCNYIRKQARPDGSLVCTDPGPDGKPAADETSAIDDYTGLALYGLMRSQIHRPAAWKTDLVRKAVAYYRPWWQAHKSMEFTPWLTAACREAYQRTKISLRRLRVRDERLALRPAICQLDAQRELWFGGFKSWADGKAVEAAPTIDDGFLRRGAGRRLPHGSPGG